MKFLSGKAPAMSLLEAFDIRLDDFQEFDLQSPVQPLGWMDDAICKGRTHLFFPPKAERPQARVRREALARKLCNSCPVQLQCQAFARDNREYGYWGGESEEERHLAGFTVAAPIGVRSRRLREAS